MKRLQLTDEEVRHIEQRRDNEKRFNLGYNQAIEDMITFLDTDNDDDRSSWVLLREFCNTNRKTIR